MYTTNENKYTGEEDDFFRPKLLKFREICTQWEIPEDTMPKLFPLMLTGKAAEYYTGNISPNKPGINKMIAQIQAHFETEANFELFEGQWDELTFHKALVPDMLAEYVEHGQCERPAKTSSAGTTLRPPPVHTSAHAPAAADNEEQLPVESPKNASAGRQEIEETLLEESASTQPELVSSFREKPSADPVDQTVADHDTSVAIASKVNLAVPRENEDLVGENDEKAPATELPDLEDSPADPLLIAGLTVSKDHAADEVRDDPLRRRRLEDLEGDFSDAVVDRDPAIDEPPTDLPDPHDIYRKRCEDRKEERSAKPPIKENSQADSILVVPTVSKDPAADEILGDPPDPYDRKPEDHEKGRTVDPPDKKTISADPTADGDPLASADHAFVEWFAKSVGEGSRSLSEEHPDKDTALQLKDPRDENPATPLDKDPSEIPTDLLDGIKRKRKKKRFCEGKYVFSGQRKLLPPGTAGAAWARLLTLPALLMLLIRAVPSLVVITFLLINFFRYLGKHRCLAERLVP
ncbi:hypothetical protein E4U09_000303 [Claviceps aff. purpurea]|uniref:Uncharacterized protein n=1 Tax=Claviceps aff. purpurea TaxID=1967640 RepID=A0A9P7TZA9_9HYPO|nr:hypothetical protein E4U09_000303 [Claviceps aff. purpurea]